ncbi:hypothetical protein B0H14DRAFT_2659480 [Mycena olivaceomarginata]|nr:hypothetical protein B0H14DRAFT_2659480 [Mycena olivaceomarginata]
MSGPSAALGCPIFVFLHGMSHGFFALTYHPPQAEQKNLWDVPWSHFECWTPGTSGPEKSIFAGIYGWIGLGGVGGGQKAGLRAAILLSTVCTRLQACSTVCAPVAGGIPRTQHGTAWVAGGYSVQHGCAPVAGGIPRARHGCARVAGGYSAQPGLRSIAGSVTRSTVALRLRAVFHVRSTVVLGLRALRLRACSMVALRLWGGIPCSTVALWLRAVFRAAQLRSSCGRAAWLRSGAGVFHTARLRSGCG